MNFRWTIRECLDENAVQSLILELSLAPPIARVLVARGVKDVGEASRFFQPSTANILSPWLMAGMSEAVSRVETAIANGERVWIHGDYDVDGTSSTAMMLQFLREAGVEVEYFIPERLQSSYGFLAASVDAAAVWGATLIITVDCGITANESVSHATTKGIDVIICDHHEPTEVLPNALAILDPIRPDCSYPNKHLAGCGVAFKLIQAVCDKQGNPAAALQYIDFVALASAADIVPLIGENRVLSAIGLAKLNSNPNPGIKGLIDCAGMKLGTLTNTGIVFGLAPRINAAGRLGDARRAVEMMAQKSDITSFRMAQELEHDNRKRRTIDEFTFEEADVQASAYLGNINTRALVLHSPTWHAGVIGIVASRMVERYHMPAIILTSINGSAKGSARSVREFDIHGALKQCEDLLTEFGGHKHAAGLSMPVQNVESLRERINAIVGESISRQEMVPELLIDTEMNLDELVPNFIETLSRFAPFGTGNQRPLFLSRGVVAVNGCRVVGSNHLKFRAMQKNFAIDAIGFNMGNRIHECASGRPFSLVFSLEDNSHNGRHSPQIRIRDLRPE